MRLYHAHYDVIVMTEELWVTIDKTLKCDFIRFSQKMSVVVQLKTAQFMFISGTQNGTKMLKILDSSRSRMDQRIHGTYDALSQPVANESV